MASDHPSKAILLVVLLLSSCFALGKSDIEYMQLEASLKVSVNSAIAMVKGVINILPVFIARTISDFRKKNAFKDCLELMELSMDQLSLTLHAFENQNVNGTSTGKLGSDLKTWLSGALINQETCRDGFNGTSGIMKTALSKTLDKISSLVHSILSEIKIDSEIQTVSGSDPIPSSKLSVDAVVSGDGTGNFTTITEAVNAAPDRSLIPHVIHVKRGIYRDEHVEIGSKKWNIVLIGDGMDVTVVSGSRSVVDGWTTFRSATFSAKGKGFIARDMTFENTAGPEKHQAVAFRSDSDLSGLFRCGFRGYQDTLYAHSQRQFFKKCVITGTVDFIFGDGAVVLQDSTILARRGLLNQKNTITAQGRNFSAENTGFTFQFCNISVEPDVVNSTIQTYLGRPWKSFSRTVIMQSSIGAAISPAGWLEWNGTQSLDTLFYGEYSNFGPGAVLDNRVTWPGYHVLNTTAEANGFTVSEFIFGDAWLPLTGINYTAGLKA